MSCEQEYVVLSGRAHPEFAEKMEAHLTSDDFRNKHEDDIHANFVQVKLGEFPSSENFVKIEESVRGKKVFVVQSHGGRLSVNDALVEQCLIIQAAKQSSAEEVIAVCPYMGYMRQDKKKEGRESLSAKFVVDALERAAFADGIMTVNMHSSQIQSFPTVISLDHLTASLELENYAGYNFPEEIREHKLAVVAPDAGRVAMAREFQTELKLPLGNLGIVFKGRSPNAQDDEDTISNEVESYGILGDVAGKTTLLLDDLIDTFGTLEEASMAIEEAGAKRQFAMGVHAVLSNPVNKESACERLNRSPIENLIVTDTLPLPEDQDTSKIKVVTASYLVGDAIHASANVKSISELFQGRNYF